MSQPGDFTRLLSDLRSGDRTVLDQLTPMVYEELHRLAGSLFRQQRSDHTLQSTALVHEAWLKLSGSEAAPWQSRAHFMAVAARAMRQILIDHSRSHRAAKRGSGGVKVELEEGVAFTAGRAPEVLALDESLSKLAEFDARKARIVEMRYFGGLTGEEIAEVEQISTATVTRELRMAQAWLYQQMSGSATAGE